MNTDLVNKINNNIKNKAYDDNYRIYASTNENLDALFKRFDVKDKRVLTVLASSDQFLSCIHKGARKIDTFDRSIITYFYYYLRKWLITYKNMLYPTNLFFSENDPRIYELVNSINPINSDEEKAKTFWLEYLKSNNNKGSQYVFEAMYCKGNVPFNLDIKDKLPNKINFYCMDFCDRLDIDKKYDVIILSNMLEYIEKDYNNEKKEIVRENLEKLLDINGIAICSYKTKNRFSKFHLNERDIITKNNLVLDRETKYYEPAFGQEIELAYSYRKIV